MAGYGCKARLPQRASRQHATDDPPASPRSGRSQHATSLLVAVVVGVSAVAILVLGSGGGPGAGFLGVAIQAGRLGGAPAAGLTAAAVLCSGREWAVGGTA